ncbi:MAG: aspartate aminotransferase family protein [Alphaproteobacteria bacterium]|nr:aspartate aminotransferase family protein [Alphaproteobacteria bacterium]
MATQPLARTNDYYAGLKRHAGAIEARYRALTPKSASLFAEAQQVFPGGFTRDAFLRKPYAPFVQSGDGAVLTDADGRQIVDFWFNATSLPLGHRHPKVVAAVEDQLKRGTAFFAPGENEITLGHEVLKRLPGADLIRFTNSGSEAVMLALRLARGHTGRDLIAKFEGSYHGTYDDVSWSVGPAANQLGPADRPNAAPESAGLPTALGRTLVLPFNDLDATARIVGEHEGRIAAVIIEPMANRMGLILPSVEFTRGLRSLCDRHGIVLIFDEVIAFRVSYNGAQGLLGVTPDLTTLGKIIGGGFPVGAVAGRRDIMMRSAPYQAGRVTHAGTFNANPVTAAAGLATMRELTPALFDRLAATGADIRTRLAKVCSGLPLQVTGAGSLFKITATDRQIRSYRDAVTADRAWEELASLDLINRGFLTTTQLQGCVSAVTTPAQIDGLVAGIEALVRAS